MPKGCGAGVVPVSNKLPEQDRISFGKEHPELAEQGLDVTASPTVDGAGRQAFFKDPTGNIIELNQPG